MRTESIEGAARAVSALGLLQPRIVTSGNFASPVTVLAAVLAELPQARLHALNAQLDLPVREGVVPETTFVGA